MTSNPSRRSFLRSAPLAAATPFVTAAALTLPDALLAQTAPAAVPFQLFSAAQLTEDRHKLQAAPGNNNLFANPTLPFTLVLTTEANHAAPEFEWHEGRDHIVQVLEGETVYEVGGTPQQPRNVRTAEWLAPAAAGATRLALGKGDVLVIPRGTPHKRSTAASVTFYLISTTGK